MKLCLNWWYLQSKKRIKTTIALCCIQLFTFQLSGQSYVENHLLNSAYLQEDRKISVALPVDYKKSNKSYPVLYILDGEYIFDYAKGTADFLTNEFGYLPPQEMSLLSYKEKNKSLDKWFKWNNWIQQNISLKILVTNEMNIKPARLHHSGVFPNKWNHFLFA